MGADIQAFKVYEFAQSNDVTVVGGECRTVDVAGEHVIGGGHWPLSSIYGMTADQILAIEVVNPDGRFVTVSASENTDLYWALRGGSGSTFGVVTSLNCKVYPVITSTVMTFSFEVGGNLPRTFSGQVCAPISIISPTMSKREFMAIPLSSPRALMPGHAACSLSLQQIIPPLSLIH